MSPSPTVIIDQEACIGCGVCAAMCPKGILVMEAATGKCSVTEPEKCDRRAGCERACPVNAIKIR